MGQLTTGDQPPNDRSEMTSEYWRFEPDRALYMRGFWWEVTLHFGEWVVWPATTLNKFMIYGPFKSMEAGMYWLEHVFFADGGEFEKRYPHTGE